MDKEYIYIVWGDGCDYMVVDTVFHTEDVAQRRAGELNAVDALALDWYVKKVSVHSNLHGLIHPDDDGHEGTFINT